MKKLLIDEQLRDLFPPLTNEEFEQLEANILRNGCREAICTWNNYIVDGHNRYNICTKHNYGFKVIELEFDNKDEVIQWMVETQLGRRNLTPIQKIAITEKYRPIYKEMAENNKSLNGGNKLAELQKSSTPLTKVHVRNELSKLAGVSHDTYSKGKKILDSNNEEIKQKVLTGELKINTAYNELFGKKEETEKSKSKTKICIKCGIEKSNEDFYIGHDKCKECELSEIVKVPKKSEVFKDINGNPKPINEELFDEQQMNEILKDIKTPKNYQDYIDPIVEIEWVEEICEELFWQLESKFFSLHNVAAKMDNEHIDLTIDALDTFIEKINNLKNKLNESKGE